MGFKETADPFRSRLASIYPIQSEKGVSLVAVLVSIAITGILSAGMGSVFVFQMQMSKNLERQMDAIDLQRSVSVLWAETDQCTKNFAGLVIPASGEVSIPELKYFDASGTGLTPLVTTAANPPAGALAAKSIKLVSIAPGLTTTATLQIEFPDTKGASAEIALKPAKLSGISFTTTATGAGFTVQSCNKGGQPSSLAGLACSTGQALTGINPDGTVQCMTPPAPDLSKLKPNTNLVMVGGTINSITSTMGDVKVIGIPTSSIGPSNSLMGDVQVKQ